MIGVRILPEKFEQFLRERYYLELELKNVNELKSGNTKSKNCVQRQRLLNGLFIMRILHDPYFSLYVCKRIEQENFDLKDVLAYIHHIILENYLCKSSLFSGSENSKKENLLTGLFASESENNKKIDDLIHNFSEGLELSRFTDNEYYWKLYSLASEKNEKNILDALNSIKGIGKEVNSSWQDESPFNWSDTSNPHSVDLIYYSRHLESTCEEEEEVDRLYHEQEKKRVLLTLNYKDLRSQTRFMYENMRSCFRNSYYGNGNLFNTSFWTFLNFKADFILEIRNLLENYGMVKSHDDNEIAKFLKFYMDAVFISQFYWFISLNEKDKVEILNKYYDDIDFGISNFNLNLFGKSSLLHYLAFDEARKLFEARDCDNAISIFTTVLENTDDEFLKFQCISWIAYTYRGKNDFKSSLKHFEEAYEISRRFTKNTPIAYPFKKFLMFRGRVHEGYRAGKLHFKQYVVLLKMAEMYCYLQNKEKANDCYEKINNEINKYSIPKKIEILFFLASYCDYYQQYKLKSRYYQMALDLAESYEDAMVDSIEKDMNEEIFSMLEFTNITREKCVRKWINCMIEGALKNLATLRDISSNAENWTDLVNVYDDYNKSFEYNPERVGKLQMILESSKLDDVVSGYAAFSNTLEPRRRIAQIKNTMNELREFDGKENEKYFDIEPHDLIQRLKLECSRCYYVLEDFDKAEHILREILVDSKEESVLFNAHCVLGMALIKSWDVRSGIRELEKALDFAPQNDLYKHAGILFEYIRDELISLNNEDIFLKVLDSVVDKVDSKVKYESNYKENGHLLASIVFNEFELTKEANYLIERGLKLCNHELVKVALLEEKAYLKYLDGDFVESEDILNEIVRISFNRQEDSIEYLLFCSSAWHKISVLYARKSEFEKASELIGLAIDKIKKYNNLKGIYNSNWELKRYEILKEIYEIFSKDVITLSKINNKEVIDLFNTAEEIVFDGVNQRKNRDFDFSLAFVGYGKGLETYLHDSFSVKLRNEVLGRHGTPVDNPFWDGDKDKDVERIPLELKNLLWADKEKTVNLGSWKDLIEDAFCSDIKSINNHYIRDSYEFIRNSMSKEKWDTTAEACAVVSVYRNEAAHYGKRPLKYILRYREKIIEQINEVISIGASVWN